MPDITSGPDDGNEILRRLSEGIGQSSDGAAELNVLRQGIGRIFHNTFMGQTEIQPDAMIASQETVDDYAEIARHMMIRRALFDEATRSQLFHEAVAETPFSKFYDRIEYL